MRLSGRRGAGPASLKGAALLACLVALSCASDPAPARDPAPGPAPLVEAASAGKSVVPASPVPAGQGTALKTAEPAELSKARDERAAIEAAIALGSPSSLNRALDLVEASTLLKPEDAEAYRRIALGVMALAYPESGERGSVSGAQASIAPQASAPPVAPASTALAAALSLLAEAQAGRVQSPPPEAVGTPLGELLPALALFRADSRDVARRATEALDRFARLGLPSALPSLALGIDAERQKEYPGALARYGAALAIAPDAWSASLGSGRVLLELGRAAESIAYLEPLAPRFQGGLGFDRPFARALVENGRFYEADPIVARVLTVDPQDSAFILIRARLLARGKAYQQALPLLDAYGTVDPSNRLFLILRSRVAEGLKSRDEALRWARRGLASYPDDPELLVATARLLYAGAEAGRFEARTTAERAAAQLGTPESAPWGPADRADRLAARVEAARLLAGDAASRYDWKAAAGYYATASKAAPFEDRNLAATILRESRQYPAALEYAAAWYKEAPGSDEAGLAYVRALVESGDGRSAQELIARLLPASRSGSFRSALFFLQSGLQGSDEAALPLLRSALMEDASNFKALAALSDIQARRKDFAKARFYLKQALALAPDDPDLLRRQVELDKAGQ